MSTSNVILKQLVLKLIACTLSDSERHSNTFIRCHSTHIVTITILINFVVALIFIVNAGQSRFFALLVKCFRKRV